MHGSKLSPVVKTFTKQITCSPQDGERVVFSLTVTPLVNYSIPMSCKEQVTIHQTL